MIHPIDSSIQTRRRPLRLIDLVHATSGTDDGPIHLLGHYGDALLRSILGETPPAEANDGIVPLRSQLWGEPVWIGRADHLDVVGYFGHRTGAGGWLTCGANFDRHSFTTMMDRIFDGMLAGEEARV